MLMLALAQDSHAQHFRIEGGIFGSTHLKAGGFLGAGISTYNDLDEINWNVGGEVSYEHDFYWITSAVARKRIFVSNDVVNMFTLGVDYSYLTREIEEPYPAQPEVPGSPMVGTKEKVPTLTPRFGWRWDGGRAFFEIIYNVNTIHFRFGVGF